MAPFSCLFNVMCFLLLFKENNKFKYWFFPLGIDNIFLAALFNIHIILLDNEIISLLTKTSRHKWNQMQIFTCKTESHSTSYCLHDSKSSDMWIRCCLDCRFCVFGGCVLLKYEVKYFYKLIIFIVKVFSLGY